MYKHPDLVRDEQILASPTLLVKSSQQDLRIIGDMSTCEKILGRLGFA
jgi:hypothetical protein